MQCGFGNVEPWNGYLLSRMEERKDGGEERRFFCVSQLRSELWCESAFRVFLKFRKVSLLRVKIIEEIQIAGLN